MDLFAMPMQKVSIYTLKIEKLVDGYVNNSKSIRATGIILMGNNIIPVALMLGSISELLIRSSDVLMWSNKITTAAEKSIKQIILMFHMLHVRNEKIIFREDL